MGNLFKDLTAGFSTFVLAWLVPSAVVSAVFALFVYPPLADTAFKNSLWAKPLRDFVGSGALAATAVFALAVVVVALVASLAAKPLYRILEGYTLPRPLARWMYKKQRLRRRRLIRDASRESRGFIHRRALAREALGDYPSDEEEILPTRLGNAFKALETYGNDHYNLDSQSLYYEVFSAAPERCRLDADQTRSSVDFFVSLVALQTILGTISFAAGVASSRTQCYVVAVVAFIFVRPAYLAAVGNMTDWRYAMQALVNLSRPELARCLGYRLPKSLSDERDFWDAWNNFVAFGRDVELLDFDGLRVRYDLDEVAPDKPVDPAEV